MCIKVFIRVGLEQENHTFLSHAVFALQTLNSCPNPMKKFLPNWDEGPHLIDKFIDDGLDLDISLRTSIYAVWEFKAKRVIFEDFPRLFPCPPSRRTALNGSETRKIMAMSSFLRILNDMGRRPRIPFDPKIEGSLRDGIMAAITVYWEGCPFEGPEIYQVIDHVAEHAETKDLEDALRDHRIEQCIRSIASCREWPSDIVTGKAMVQACKTILGRVYEGLEFEDAAERYGFEPENVRYTDQDPQDPNAYRVVRTVPVSQSSAFFSEMIRNEKMHR